VQSTSTEQAVVQFAATSYDAQISQLGGDQATEPPDTQIAAGPSDILVMTNSSGSIYAKNGALIHRFDLTTFFGLPTGYYFGDPRVLYDAGSGRWLASCTSFDGSFDSAVYLAVSATSDPNGTWQVFTVAGNTQQTLYDQPKLGYSDDKVVLSWSDYGSGATSYTGQETWVLEKSDLLAGRDPTSASYGPDLSHFDLVPAQMLGSSSPIYLVYNNADPFLAQSQSFPSLGVIAITGTPAGGNVTWIETDLAASATSVPPNAIQPGSAAVLDTNDDRLLFAVWQGGTLWTGGNDACVPAGDSGQHACLRLFQVSTSPTPALLQDFDVGQGQTDLFFPSLTLDGAGNAFIVASESSAATRPSAVTFAQAAGSVPGAAGALQVVEGGLGVYDCGAGCADGGGVRWGDYSGSAPDPADPTTVWVAAEYAASAQDALDWGVGVARVGLAGVDPGNLSSTPTPSAGTRVYLPITRS
jgi:hypothetical protein